MKLIYQLPMCIYGLLLLFTTESRGSLPNNSEIKGSNVTEPEYKKQASQSFSQLVDLDGLKDKYLILNNHRFKISYIVDLNNHYFFTLTDPDSHSSIILSADNLEKLSEEFGEKLEIVTDYEGDFESIGTIETQDLFEIISEPASESQKIVFYPHNPDTRQAQWFNWNNWGNKWHNW